MTTPVVGARRAATVPGTNSGSFAPSTTAEVDLDLTPASSQPEPGTAIEPEDVKVSPQGIVKTRTDGTVLGRVDTHQDETGKKTWTPVTADGHGLTYAATGTPRRYDSRARAVRGLLNHVNGTDRPEHWFDVPAYDWTGQSVSQWGHRTTADDALRGHPLLHGSPHRFEEGDILLPDQAPSNFKQSDPFVVSVTTENRLASSWAGDAAGPGTDYYVYEVEPLTDLELWNYHLDGLHTDPARGPVGTPVSEDGPRLVLHEGRVGAARILSRTKYTRSQSTR